MKPLLDRRWETFAKVRAVLTAAQAQKLDAALAPERRTLEEKRLLPK